MFLSVPVKGVARQAAICCAVAGGSCCAEASIEASSADTAAPSSGGALRTGPYSCKTQHNCASALTSSSQ